MLKRLFSILFIYSTAFTAEYPPVQLSNEFIYSQGGIKHIAACGISAAAISGVNLDIGEYSLSLGVGKSDDSFGTSLIFTNRCYSNLVIGSCFSIGISLNNFDALMLFSLMISCGDFL